jgi:hypothetical protein
LSNTLRHGSRLSLEHEAAVAAGAAHRAAVEQDVAGTCRFQPGDDAQQRGLAAAARADEGDELAMGDVGIDIAQHLEVAEALAECPDGELGVVFHRI